MIFTWIYWAVFILWNVNRFHSGALIFPSAVSPDESGADLFICWPAVISSEPRKFSTGLSCWAERRVLRAFFGALIRRLSPTFAHRNAHLHTDGLHTHTQTHCHPPGFLFNQVFPVSVFFLLRASLLSCGYGEAETTARVDTAREWVYSVAIIRCCGPEHDPLIISIDRLQAGPFEKKTQKKAEKVVLDQVSCCVEILLFTLASYFCVLRR